VLTELLLKVISDKLHAYLNEAEHAQKAKDTLNFDSAQATSKVESLEARARTTIKAIRRDFRGDQGLLQQITEAFKDLKEAHQRAVDRIETIEEEKERMTQLAGIGLMIEVIAHELTRATEYTQATLRSIDRQRIDTETAAVFRALEQQIRIIQRRLQILEPLTISSRQRRAHRDLVEVVSYVLEAHNAQFERHGIRIEAPEKGAKAVTAFIVEGHVVQILENLIANSVYWLDLYKDGHRSFAPLIRIRLADDPPKLLFSDNGPGIPATRAETVFEPFYSTKPKSASRRSGLGLYVARQNAELLGGTLELIEEGSEHEGRFNTFELTLRKDAS
jgi:signal transduction histidine kinase